MRKMRNVKKMLKEDDIGDMGIGAMIVFIAMVLVAGIAASVLIQTANRLEIQAMKTGQETTNEVATGIGIEAITGEVGGGGTIDNVAITVSPRSGSMDVDLSNTVVEISNSASKYILTYDNTHWFAAPAAAGVFGTAAFPGSTHLFGVIVLEDADGSCAQLNPVINRGDHVLLTLSSLTIFGGLTQRTDIWGRVIPENGAPGVFAFRTPSTYSETVYALY
jgi:flagellin FlaB